MSSKFIIKTKELSEHKMHLAGPRMVCAALEFIENSLRRRIKYLHDLTGEEAALVQQIQTEFFEEFGEFLEY